MAEARFFFLHVMKTGGATFRSHVYRNFGEGEVYPVPRRDDMQRAWLVDYLLGLPAERRALIRAYTGHFPFVVTELLGEQFVTLTMLRDPVDRTLSYLKHCKRYHEHQRALDLEEIYEDPFYFSCFVHNHQAKLFSMTSDDPLESYMDVIDVDDQRLEIATTNLEKVDVIGLSERSDEFVDEVARRFGLRFRKLPNRRVSRESWEVSSALRKRIADDNAADVAFYEFAKRLHEQRRDAAVRM
ncbi:MAG: sulfotransferase family 2 domain-containing protein [Acidimicrobiia bacterium]